MATTPTRTSSFDNDREDWTTETDGLLITPRTPRYGPKFDTDYHATLARRKQDFQHQQQRQRGMGSNIKSSDKSQGHIDDGQPKFEINHDQDNAGEQGWQPDPASSRARTRTRTISGTAAGAPMLTPRETPHARRKRAQQRVSTIKRDTDAVTSDHNDRVKSVSRVLFTSKSSSNHEFKSSSNKQNATFTIFQDPDSDSESNLNSRIAQIDDDNDPFVTKPGMKPISSSLKSSSKRALDTKEGKNGMYFVFRGKRVFREFETEEQFSDDELAISPIKPRILFANATDELSSSMSLNPSSSLPSSSSSPSSPATSQFQNNIFAQKSSHDNNTGTNDHDGPVSHDFLQNVEEAETDVED
ncbi:hypothetical protein V1514DRAFT_370025 [Lipomyces japonicus]|uniref:uncharacterized protein n=1 Tax=Lipomyces japonicus TaxID=56871 RepID=UPI0034CF87F4